MTPTHGRAGSSRRRHWLMVTLLLSVAAFLAVTPQMNADNDSDASLADNSDDAAPQKSKATPRKSRAHLVDLSGRQPLTFEPNVGQTDRQVKFLSRSNRYTLFLTANEAVMEFVAGAKVEKRPSAQLRFDSRRKTSPPQIDTLRMSLAAANSQSSVVGLKPLPTRINYFLGKDPQKWQSNIPSYSQVKYHDVYPGVDLVYYGNQRQLEYDFVVQPGADPGRIALNFSGDLKRQGKALAIDKTGDLVITGKSGEVRFHKPAIYQEATAGSRRVVEGGFVLLAKNQVGFRIAPYDKSKPLVIDPSLGYSTYLGGTQMDGAAAVAVASDGSAFVAGTAGLNDFAGTTSGSYGGGFSDAFVAKLNPTASAFDYITYIGGDGGEDVFGIALDGSLNAYITGSTDSSNLPMAGGATAGAQDAYIAKLNSSGVLQFSKLIGGGGSDASSGIALDASGNMYIAGPTVSTDLLTVHPPTLSGFQTTCASCTTNSTYDTFVAKLNADGTTIGYLSYLGGNSSDYAHGLALDPSGPAGAVWVVGETDSTDFPPTTNGLQQSDPDSGLHTDAYLTKVDTTVSGSNSLLYSSYLGGDGNDQAYGIAVDGTGDLYIIGQSDSSEDPAISPGGFNTTPLGFQDVVVTKFRPSNNTILYFGFLGGAGGDGAGAIAIDSAGAAYVTGNTNSTNFDNPLKSPIDGAFNSGGGFPLDAFVAEIAPDGMSVLFSTYLGGNDTDFGSGIAVDASKNIYVVGQTNATDFAVTAGVVQSTCKGGGSFATCADGFLVKYNSGASVGPEVSATPSALNFGDVTVNSSSTKTVTLTNTGNQPLTISNAPATWITSDAFLAYAIASSPTTTCQAATPIAAGDHCDIGIIFSPAQAATYNMLLKIDSDALSNPSLYVSVTGKGAAAGATMSATPTSLAFGNQLVGSTTTMNVTVSNTGTSNLTFTSAPAISGTNAGDFVLDASSTCSTSAAVTPANNCTLAVKFTASATGNRAASLAIESNGGNTNIPLTGTGTQIALGAASGSSTSATVTAGGTATYNLTMQPTGFVGSVTVACSGAPPQSTCTPSSTSVPLDGISPANFSVAVKTAARASLGPPPNWQMPQTLPWQVMILLGLVAGAGLVAGRRRVRLACATAMLGVVMLAACGGGSPKSLGQIGTPAGNYNLTVTVTAGSVTRTLPLTLIVQ